jgi:S1-C subfamily serine protease
MGGVEILGVDPQSAAAVSGLQKGNVITEVNGRKVASTQDLAGVLVQNSPGSRIAVVYLYKTNLGWMAKETMVVLTK